MHHEYYSTETNNRVKILRAVAACRLFWMTPAHWEKTWYLPSCPWPHSTASSPSFSSRIRLVFCLLSFSSWLTNFQLVSAMLAWLGDSMAIFWVAARFRSRARDRRSPRMKTAVLLLIAGGEEHDNKLYLAIHAYKKNCRYFWVAYIKDIYCM